MKQPKPLVITFSAKGREKAKLLKVMGKMLSRWIAKVCFRMGNFSLLQRFRCVSPS